MVRTNLATGFGVSWQDTPSALVVAHPGHQVRLHGWLGLSRPHVFVLTDGSGRSGLSRLDATTEYLAGLGIEPGRIYGQHTDRAIYRRILDRDLDFFIALAEQLAESLAASRVRFVAGDAAEGYNSIHDICRLVVDAAVEMLNRGGGGAVSFDYPVINRPDDCPEELREASVWLRLDDQTFSRKIDAARTYYPELFEEVQIALGAAAAAGPMRDYFELNGAGGGEGIEAFRVECLRPAVAARADRAVPGAKPFYELHGERQVAAGLYDHVIRYREHVAPIAERLWRYVK
ncbi:MAG: hypothetical protein LC746_13045 [Acidobacteria bacterium]|nr:hypothetical protein [Acidobacteriota bacterium]